MNFKNILKSKWAVFAGGILFGTAGFKILGSTDAKKFYTNVVAKGLKAKECVMTAVTQVQENAEDILAEAKAINGIETDEITEEE